METHEPWSVAPLAWEKALAGGTVDGGGRIDG